MTTSGISKTVSEEYAALIRDELALEQATAVEFRQRAAGVITTSSALVALLTGLLAVAFGSHSTHNIHGAALAFLVLALVAFFLATGAAVLINKPRKHIVRAHPDGLKELIAHSWRDASSRASREVASLQVDELASLRVLNRTNSGLLVCAVAFELLALAFLGMVALLLVV